MGDTDMDKKGGIRYEPLSSRHDIITKNQQNTNNITIINVTVVIKSHLRNAFYYENHNRKVIQNHELIIIQVSTNVAVRVLNK